MALKIAVSGKGGVGKTTVAGILARLFGRDGKEVLVLDADPASNLASAIGVPKEVAEKIVPLSRMLDLIEERTGVRPGSSYGGVFTINPKVDDISAKYAVEGKDGVKLLVLGTISTGGGGCFCPESALLKNLIRHLVLQKNQYLIMDMEAGLEHLGRASSRNMDVMLVVVEPGMRSLETAAKIKELANQIGIKRVVAVLNKASSQNDKKVVEETLNKSGLPLATTIPFNRMLIEADLKGVSPLDVEGTEDVVLAIRKLKEELEKEVAISQ
ncbi:MAG: AAA family ATPase [Methanomassiliicoccales archaeon]|jgi:CO dehydrogenase maturation factor|nr:AAA family ATPase [Methanomassiliicoccales archaeon]